MIYYVFVTMIYYIFVIMKYHVYKVLLLIDIISNMH